MTTLQKKIEELLIVSLTPQNLERGILWFAENLDSIKKARLSNPWWRENTLCLEKDLCLKPSELARKVSDFGYERSSTVLNKGLFAVRGGIIEIWPLNSNCPYLIEFAGNVISDIYPRPENKEIGKSRPKAVSASLEKLSRGGFVVHEDHGIGIYFGITDHLPAIEGQPAAEKSKYFVVEYAAPRPGAEPDKLYVPLEQASRLTIYIGFEIPKIHRLGGSVWQTTKRKAKEDAQKLAKELLELYAKRSLAERPSYEGDQTLEEEIRQGFAYVETEDQIRAEREILRDLEKQVPMDRILCGDVGFGKTEIALRAAMRAITSGRQVALLSPTTILAAQHEKTFQERTKNLPLKVKMLSRLSPSKEEKEILKELKQGKIDCLIGTHRLLSADVSFKNLGLLIIDEEQRFGVKQKEKLKEIRTELDILSLSATPIPRTLQLSLAKLRDISLLSTPPPERKSILTAVLPYTKKIIREAIDFELERGGQIYFLHNRIETMGQVRKKLLKLKTKRPLRIEIIHGRMKEKEILKAMENFRGHRCDILLATTIIENGLDISSANTLIVDEATRLGLAEAHQLRGRIGRGPIQAFAYFLYKPKHLTEQAKERLETIKEYSELGSGYEIAMRDLEIRGAGNILGKEQSGSINKVGLNLYYQMLNEAIETEKQNRADLAKCPK